jgi:hypothetical protein
LASKLQSSLSGAADNQQRRCFIKTVVGGSPSLLTNCQT